MIRVLSLGSAERSLLKGFTGAVTDLAFAHLDSALLGCVDEAGNLFVWQLTCHNNKILYPLCVSVCVCVCLCVCVWDVSYAVRPLTVPPQRPGSGPHPPARGHALKLHQASDLVPLHPGRAG